MPIIKFALCFVIFISFLGANDKVFSPITNEIDYDINKAMLGKKLFFDSRISKKLISCENCHHLSRELTGTSQQRFPNPSTILNSSLNKIYGNSGEHTNLEEYIKFKITSIRTLATTEYEAITRIKKIPDYTNLFENIYGSEAKMKFVQDAIAHFIRSLKTPSKFDDYLLGDKNAFTQDEKEGLDIFLRYACISCHNGVNLGGNLIITRTTRGRSSFLKVPILRNILKTAPYLYNGSANTIGEVFVLLGSKDIIIKHKKMNEEEFNKLMAFFGTLNGKTPEILR